MGSIGGVGNVAMETFKLFYNESNSSLATRLYNVVKAGVITWNPAFGTIVIGVSETVIYSAYAATYFVQLNNLKNYFNSFSNL